jgi:crotonobetainyl-CoA:carnitine CoA-transferase CaiB-like acyl-CoA transferase
VELAMQIIKISDVVSENYSPRVMKKMGLDYEPVKEIKSVR